MDAKDNPNEDVIDKVEVFIIRAPLGKAKFWSSQASFPERNSLLVKITSSGCNDDGKKLVGWGEAGQYGPPEPVASAIEHVLAPRIMGQQILPTKINEELYAFSRDFGQRGTYIEAISGIDIALWDLLGKKLKTPVCKLLGGNFRNRVKIRASTSVPIAGGECSFTRYGFRDLFVGNNGACLDIAQPDIAACGEISEFIKICALASTFGVTVIPHVWGSAVGLAAGLHAVATLPLNPYTANPIYLENEPVIEFDRNPNPLRDEILKGHIFELEKSDGGSLAVPINSDGGLGIEVDEDAITRFNVPLTHTGIVKK